jgi:hypothetical protein
MLQDRKWLVSYVINECKDDSNDNCILLVAIFQWSVCGRNRPHRASYRSLQLIVWELQMSSSTLTRIGYSTHSTYSSTYWKPCNILWLMWRRQVIRHHTTLPFLMILHSFVFDAIPTYSTMLLCLYFCKSVYSNTCSFCCLSHPHREAFKVWCRL